MTALLDTGRELVLDQDEKVSEIPEGAPVEVEVKGMDISEWMPDVAPIVATHREVNDRYGNRIRGGKGFTDGYLINLCLVPGVFKTPTEIAAEITNRPLPASRVAGHLEYWMKWTFRTGIKVLTLAQTGKELAYSVDR